MSLKLPQLGSGGGRQDTLVHSFEHLVLRVVSFVFSIVSAHAIRWIFSPLDTVAGADPLQVYITWLAAAGFGILGYFVSRGLAYRMMRKESFWSYIPICVVVELVEVFANYAQAAAVIQHANWISSAPEGQRGILVVATYIMLSIVPFASVFLAVVDMDLERNKQSRGAIPQSVTSRAAFPQPAPAKNTLSPVSPQRGPAPAAPAGSNSSTQGAANPLRGVRPPQVQPVGATS